MSKYKLISLIVSTTLVTGVAIGASALNSNHNNSNISNTILLSAPANNKNEAVVINTNKSPLVLYKNADSNSNIVSYISVGEMLNVQSSGSDFYKVQVEETGATGYIPINDLQMITSGVNSPLKTINKEGNVINVDSIVHLRANATMNSNILTDLKNGTSLNILGKQGSWYKVEVNGTTGFLYQSYVGETNITISNSTTKTTSSNVTSNVATNSNSKNSSVGSLAYDLQDANASSSAKAKPLTTTELMPYLGTWTVGQSVASLGGGSAYGSDGIPNLPGKTFTINKNFINYFGKEIPISNYYLSKQNTVGGTAYGQGGIVPNTKGTNPLNVDHDGYVLLLSGVSGQNNPTLSDLNNGESAVSFIISGKNLIVDDAGTFFTATNTSSNYSNAPYSANNKQANPATTSTTSSNANNTSSSNSTNKQNTNIANKTSESAPTLASLYGTWAPTKIVGGIPNDESTFKLSDIKSNVVINSNGLTFKSENAIIPAGDLTINKISNAEFKENYFVGLSSMGVNSSSVYYLNGPNGLQFYITSPNTIVINLGSKFVEFTRQ